VTLLLLFTALAAEPCPVVAQGAPLPPGTVESGRLACDGVLVSTSDLASLRADLLQAQAAEQRALAELERERAKVAILEGEVEAVSAERDGEHIARVAAQAALESLTRTRPPVPGWVAVASGAGLGLGACWLAPGAPQWR